MKKKLRSKKALTEKVSTALATLESNEQLIRVNLTDPDAPIMKGKKGDFNTNYNVQVACNEKQIISFCDVVTAGNDKSQLIPCIKGARKNIRVNIKTVLADADYGTFDSFEYMDSEGILGFVPYRDMNSTFESTPYHSSHFKYNNETDQYQCPANEIMKFVRIQEDKRAQKKYRIYRTEACRQCPLKNECFSKSNSRRTIYREVRQELRDVMKKRLNSAEGKKTYVRRLHPIESIFGHFKYNLGYTQFLLRGIEKVKAEFTLMCLSYNLRKLANKINSCIQNLAHHWLQCYGRSKNLCHLIFLTIIQRIKHHQIHIYINQNE